MSEKKPRIEEFEVDGEKILSHIKEVVRAGNVRRITIKTADGKTLIEIPLTVGVVVGLVAPVLAAVGAIAALVTKCVVVVERIDESE